MKTILIILFLFISFRLYAPVNEGMLIFKSDGINPFEDIWKAICQVESSNNPFAIGDNHLIDKSYGIAQIRKSRLNDYYKKTNIRYSEYDMFDVDKSKELFMFYASQYNHYQIEDISCSWNAGPNWRKIKSVHNYYLKIQKVL